MTYEGLRLKIRNKVYIPITCKHRGKKLKCKQFTILSNNCWGGTVYEAYNLKKQSPTVGLFFMASDYIRFLANIHYYLSKELEFISPNESKYKTLLSLNSNWGSYPIAVLGDIELHLLHYHGTEDEIKDKWKRRVQRIDWEHLLVKFNDQNGCTQEDIEAFFALPYKNKLFFTCKHNENNELRYGKEYVVVKQPKNNISVLASYEPFKKTKNLNLTEYINSLGR